MRTHSLAQIPETEHPDGHVVRPSNVVKVYKAGDVEVSAIKGITFDIPRQRFSMIVGPSGSGKPKPQTVKAMGYCATEQQSGSRWPVRAEPTVAHRCEHEHPRE
jgi:ABC-type dipeptide/oligopeptide/nickel transport system ATPase component